MDNGITPVIPMGSDGFGGGAGFMWIFGLLILLGMFNGGFGYGGNGNTNALQADVNRGFDNQNLQAQSRDILAAVSSAQLRAWQRQIRHSTTVWRLCRTCITRRPATLRRWESDRRRFCILTAD